MIQRFLEHQPIFVITDTVFISVVQRILDHQPIFAIFLILTINYIYIESLFLVLYIVWLLFFNYILYTSELQNDVIQVSKCPTAPSLTVNIFFSTFYVAFVPLALSVVLVTRPMFPEAGGLLRNSTSFHPSISGEVKHAVRLRRGCVCRRVLVS